VQPLMMAAGMRRKALSVATEGEQMATQRKAINLEPVWLEYKQTGDLSLRNVLLETYQPLVRYNAERIWAKLPDEVELDDLVSAGVFGLMDAIDAFDLSRGVKFETYCSARIRGAILDALRDMDIVPRLVRSRARKIDQATRELEMELGREPRNDEIARHMGMSEEDYEKLEREATAVTFVSLSRPYLETDGDRDVREVDVVEDKRSEDPVVELQKKDVRDLVTKGLSRAERLILLLYYYEEMTMKEIGATLDLSESRVSQMHSAILARLRDQLVQRHREFSA
jgi:RNA polymerase sigma factor for flagellar operon FliA